MHPAYSGFSPNLPYQWSYIKILNLQKKKHWMDFHHQSELISGLANLPWTNTQISPQNLRHYLIKNVS